ncbi:MAG: UvrB/UvrC motif-containing protein [Defluviitaleaceae bacterium]|nr:UvrB/UvrC motif-containing protein [Defluviitaleaceae bacterium]
MLCEKCNKNQATVHLQQFVNGKKTEVRLCQQCSFSAEMPFALENIFLGLIDQAKNQIHMPGAKIPDCKNCGMKFEEFRTGGKLGCNACYDIFPRPVEALIKNVQANTRHVGKIPKRAGVTLIQKRQADELRSRMNKAVADENFEEAARLRDQIRQLEGANQ